VPFYERSVDTIGVC